MIDRLLLLKDLQGLLKGIEADLLERSESREEVREWLASEYGAAQRQKRTALSFEEWRSDQVTQVGSAWVLNGVFVRFLEDNGLVGVPKIAGPVGEALQRARDEHEGYFRSHPRETDREYWLTVFDELAMLLRVPVADNVSGADMPKLRNLWEHLLPNMPMYEVIEYSLL